MNIRFLWIKWVIVGLFILIVSGLAVSEWQKSQIVSQLQYRFNLALIVPDYGVTFVSFDPREKSILSLSFPTSLAINSRTSGEYTISSLYTLGSYKGKGGMFARQKIQGFMRVPIPGYIVASSQAKNAQQILRGSLLKIIFRKNDTNLSRFDALVLFARMFRYSWRNIEEKELIRTGVIDNNIYHPERFQDYIGTRLFDWGIGATRVTVAIVNASGENGLGSDLADFLTNLGLDVVMVRSVPGEAVLEATEWQVSDQQTASELKYIFQNLFGFANPKLESVPEEFRSKVLIKVGKDVKELF